MNASWTMQRWSALDQRVLRASGRSELPCLCRSARTVLRSFSSSFFLVTRFLPPHKRERVELIYAAVRYPDEIVDTFPLSSEAKHRALRRWEESYDRGLAMADPATRLKAGVPWILAGFTEVVRECGIPAEHYRAFLDAMRQDIEPRVFHDLQDLIDRYIYGSAIVVGYFLAHVYGTGSCATLADSYASSANLGIALQLTNFCRDVTEDRARGRLYLPIDVVRSRGLEEAVMELSRDAEKRYQEAADSLGVFAEDTRPAIRACIDVYRLLNRRILQAGGDTRIRHSVPAAEKFSALPPGKYWRLPLAYLGAI